MEARHSNGEESSSEDDGGMPFIGTICPLLMGFRFLRGPEQSGTGRGATEG